MSGPFHTQREHAIEDTSGLEGDGGGALLFFRYCLLLGAFRGRLRLYFVADAWHFAFDITLNMQAEGIAPPGTAITHIMSN